MKCGVSAVPARMLNPFRYEYSTPGAYALSSKYPQYNPGISRRYSVRPRPHRYPAGVALIQARKHHAQVILGLTGHAERCRISPQLPLALRASRRFTKPRAALINHGNGAEYRCHPDGGEGLRQRRRFAYRNGRLLVGDVARRYQQQAFQRVRSWPTNEPTNSFAGFASSQSQLRRTARYVPDGRRQYGSPSFSASSISWPTSITVFFSLRCISRNWFWITSRLIVDRAERFIHQQDRGSAASARMTPIRCC